MILVRFRCHSEDREKEYEDHYEVASPADLSAPPEVADECPSRTIVAVEGMEGLRYVNAYSVTRHYGGPEEGGWWYNAGYPLASIPVAATWKRASYNENELELVANDEAEVDRFSEHLKTVLADVEEGDIYSVTGGAALEIIVQDHEAAEWPEERPRYE